MKSYGQVDAKNGISFSCFRHKCAPVLLLLLLLLLLLVLCFHVVALSRMTR
jgi:hypothetical protein